MCRIVAASGCRWWPRPHDQTHLERPWVRRRTLEVDTRSVGIVEFDVDDARRKGLIRNGGQAAQEFLDSWD